MIKIYPVKDDRAVIGVLHDVFPCGVCVPDEMVRGHGYDSGKTGGKETIRYGANRSVPQVRHCYQCRLKRIAKKNDILTVEATL